jgi:hypothetical protein
MSEISSTRIEAQNTHMDHQTKCQMNSNKYGSSERTLTKSPVYSKQIIEALKYLFCHQDIYIYIWIIHTEELDSG